jgi:glycine betaine transporter
MVWFSIAGASGIELDQTLGGTLSAAAISDPAAGFFVFLQYYPLPILTSLATIFLLWIFFVAGADAGTIVMGSMSVGGDLDPNRFVRLVWGVVIGLVAAVLLLSGGIESVQQAAVVVGLPFAIIMLFICYALYKALRADYREGGLREEGEPQKEPVGQRASNPSE